MRIVPGTILLAVATILAAPVFTRAEPVKSTDVSTVILSVSPRTVRWATVYKHPDSADHDPYYHVGWSRRSKVRRHGNSNGLPHILP